MTGDTDKLSKKQQRAEEANLKRLNSLKNNRLLILNREKAISQNLKCIDSSLENKRTKFDESKDEVCSTASTSLTVPIPHNKHKLFLDEEDEDSTVLSTSFKVSAKYTGKAGQKLLAVQSKIGSDNRFRMDEKFLGDFDSNANVNRTTAPPAEGIFNDEELSDQIAQERSQQLNILERVQGKSIKVNRNYANQDECDEFSNLLENSTKPSKKLNKNHLMVRFDPENPDHYRYKRPAAPDSQSVGSLLSFDSRNAGISGKKASKSELRLAEELLESMSVRDNLNSTPNDAPSGFKVDPEFMDRLKGQNLADGGCDDGTKSLNRSDFSLLTALGRDQITVDPTIADSLSHDFSPTGKASVKNLAKWKTDLLKEKSRTISGSSSDDIDEEPDKPASSIVQKSKSTGKGAKTANVADAGRDIFFIYDHEHLIADGEKFRCNETPDVVRTRWLKLRPFLTKAYKKKKKDISRNAKKQHPPYKRNQEKTKMPRATQYKRIEI